MKTNFFVSCVKVANRLIGFLYTLLAWGVYWPCMRARGWVMFRGSVKFYPFCIEKNLLVEFMGKNRVGGNAIFQGMGLMVWGEGSYCGANCVFGVNSTIKIGNNVLISDPVSIRDTSHNFYRTDIPIKFQGMHSVPVFIEDDVWIGHGATI